MDSSTQAKYLFIKEGFLIEYIPIEKEAMIPILVRRMVNIQHAARFSFALVKNRDTEWIYSSKYEEMVASTGHQGQLRICTRPKDIKDVTLRMYKAIIESDVVLCDDQHATLELARSLVAKLPYIESIPKNQSLVEYKSDDTTRSQYDQALDLSEHLKYKLDLIKYQREGINLERILEEQRQIKIYNAKMAIKKQIENYKRKNGHGIIVEVDYRKPQDTIGLKQYSEQGLQVAFVHNEAGPATAKVLREAESAGIVYTVLPGPSELISTLAKSGFPADRFSIQYFIGELSRQRLENIFIDRKKQCLSCAIMDRFVNIQYTLRMAAKIYGQSQVAFVNYPEMLVARRPIKQLLEQLEKMPLPNQTQQEMTGCIVIAPFSLNYNEEEKERIFQIEYTKNKMLDDDVGFYHTVELQKKLNKMQIKETPEIDPVEAVKYLYSIIPDEQECIGLTMKILRVGEYQAKSYLDQAKQSERDIIRTFRKE